jgi:hypothetical protein
LIDYFPEYLQVNYILTGDFYVGEGRVGWIFLWYSGRRILSVVTVIRSTLPYYVGVQGVKNACTVENKTFTFVHIYFEKKCCKWCPVTCKYFWTVNNCHKFRVQAWTRNNHVASLCML